MHWFAKTCRDKGLRVCKLALVGYHDEVVAVYNYVGGQIPLTCNPLHPFNHPQEGPRARAFTPDNMEPEEIEAFPEYYKSVVA